MQNSTAEKFPVEEIFGTEENITFDKYEWKNFLIEIKNMVKDGKEIDFAKAMHNARYLGKLDRADEEFKAGHWVEHDIIEVEDDD